MATLEFDTTGRIESGYFYEITTTLDERDVAKAGKDWFVHHPDPSWPPLTATAVILTQDKVYECPHDPTHYTASRPKRIELDLSDGIEHTIVPELSLFLVTKPLATQLKASGLTGLTLFKTELLPDKHVDPDLEIFAVYTSGMGSCLARRVSPDSANRCFQCGFSPVLCPACGNWQTDCPKCGTECFVEFWNHKGPSDPRICVKPIPEEGPIVDATTWNGCDFFAGREGEILTWRAVRFLSQVGASPFLAKPLRARLEGITEQQEQWLKRARKPISAVPDTGN